mgnify:CR=1 FL=1
MKQKNAENPPEVRGQLANEQFKLPKKLEQMQANPNGNYTISDVGNICKKLGMELKSPKRGSHYKVFSELTLGPLTIPAKRPLKAVYIKEFIKLCSAHISKLNEGQ